MYCCQCNNELSECVCPDLKERLDSLAQSPHVHIGKEYLERIQKQAHKPIIQKSE